MKLAAYYEVRGVAALRALNSAIGLLLTIVLARSLQSEGFGQYSIIMSLVAAGAAVAGLGMAPLLTREVAGLEARNLGAIVRSVLNEAQVIVFVSSCVVVLILANIFSGELVSDSGGQVARWVAVLLVPFMVFATVKSSVLLGLRRPVSALLPDLLVRPLLFLSILFILAIFDCLTLQNALIGFFCSALVSLLLINLSLNKVLRIMGERASRLEVGADWRKKVPTFFLMAVAAVLNIESIVIVLGLVSSDSDVGVYRVAFAISLAVGIPLLIIDSIASPAITRLYAVHEMDELWSAARGYSRLAFYASSVLAIFIIVLGKFLIDVVFGLGYASAYIPIIVICSGTAVASYFGVSMQLLYATDHHSVALIISVFSAVLTLLACVVFLPKYGAVGAACIFSVGKIVRATACHLMARKLLFVSV